MTDSRGSVLVTGATGFLGAHVVRTLVKTGRRVIAARRPESDMWRLADVPGLQYADLRLDDGATIARALASTQPETIVHCAAYGVDNAYRAMSAAIAANVSGAALLVEAAATTKIRRMIHVGTSYEYGAVRPPVTEESLLAPRSLYGATKAAGFLVADQIARASGLPLVVVRPFGMYGPFEQSKKLVPMLIDACRTGTRLPLTPGEQIRDYTYVVDIADAIVRIATMEEFPAGETINLASGIPVTIRSLADAIREAVGGGDVFDWGRLPYRDNEVMASWADTSKADRLLGKIARTPLVDGIRATASSFDARGSFPS